MVYLRREGEFIRNGINIFRDIKTSIGFILKIWKFGWYVRWSRMLHCLFHQLSFNAFR